VVLVTPLIEAAKELYPNAEIHALVIPQTAVLLKNNPHLDKVWQYDKRSGERGFRAFRFWIRRIREQHYDVALVPHRSLRSAVLVYAARIPIRIGFKSSAGRWLFSRAISYSKQSHEIERNLDLLRPFGWEDKVIPPRLFPAEPEHDRIDRILSAYDLIDKPLVAIAPGSVWPTKRWLKKRFAEVIDQLWEQRRVQCILVGGPDDEALSNEILQYVHAPCISLTGQLSLLESAELLSRCKAALTNDSAPCHLSVSVSTPAVAIFGPTVTAFGFAPFGQNNQVLETMDLDCRPCGIHGGIKCPKKHFLCMKRIQTDKVVQTLEQYL